MLKLENISIALLLSAVFVNSKAVRSVSKDECTIACEEFDGQNFKFEYLCKDGGVAEHFISSLKSEINSKCGSIDFEMGDDHVKNELQLGDLEIYKNDMPSFFGDLEIVVPKSNQECVTDVSKKLKKIFYTNYVIVDTCKCPKTTQSLDESCKSPDSPFQIWLKDDSL